MKKIVFFLLVASAGFLQATAQNDPVKNTIAVFPYQHTNEADAALKTMQGWDKAAWAKFLSILDAGDSASRLQATYALNAYVHQAAGNAAEKQKATLNLLPGLASVKSFEARYQLINSLGLLGDDAAVKPLAKLLNDADYGGNAARALAMIHSDASMAALNAALPKATDASKPHIQAALDNAHAVLPDIKVQPITAKTDLNPIQQFLKLQDQMEQAANPIQKRAILNEVSKFAGFGRFMFLGRWLDDPELAPDAANMVARMALSEKSLTGRSVRQVLEKALPLIKGEDSAFLVSHLRPLLKVMPYDGGFEPIFNGKDLTGWKALVGNPITRAKMTTAELEAAQKAADEKTRGDWIVKDGKLVFTGHGDNLATTKQYGDFEMMVDWKIQPKGDAGIYLRGTPQVQIWDTSRRDVGAEVGSGGLYNNQKNPSKPLVLADNAIGEWNRFHIIMKGEKVTVYLNGVLVTDDVTLENYWDKNQPIFPREQIELQAHGTVVEYRNIYLKDLSTERPKLTEEEQKQGFASLFDGSDLSNWTGDTINYRVEDGAIVVHPEGHGAGNLYTKQEYDNFDFRFEFQLTPGANNGLGIRAPLEGDAAYVGMELQILDNEADMYKDLHPYQYHGSVYGVIPAKRGYLLPTGEWNKEEVIVKGNKVKVILNGEVILDGDIKEASKNGTMDGKEHPGLKRKTGHIGFLGHGDVLRFRNVRVKSL